jgi:SET domain-containing protein
MYDLEIKLIPGRGRGIFAKREFKNGETIEISPIIILGKNDTSRINPTNLYNYYFSWGDDSKSSAIALGYGSLYNHSYSPSAIYEKRFNDGKIVFKAIRDINSGEEITVNYNGQPEDKTPIWFEPI